LRRRLSASLVDGLVLKPEVPMTIVQLELRLWPDRDPNLHRNGIYPFEVTAEALLTALNLIGASSDSISEVEVKLSDSTLWCAIKLKNGTFGAVAPVALPGRTQIGAAPVRFSVKGHPLYKIAKYFAGPISFEFDRNAAKLHVNNGRTNLAPFHVIPLPVEEADDEGRSLGQILVPSDLHDGVKFTSVLSQIQSPDGFDFQGLRIADGRITSGYLKAVSCYACPSLPAGLDVTLPRQHIVAARSLLGRFRGKINVVETASRIHLRSRDLEIYWTKDGNWPKFSAFKKHPILATAEVESRHLIGWLWIFSLFLETLRFEIVKGDGRRMLTIFGSSTWIEGKWCEGKTSYPVVASSSDAEHDVATWDVTVSAKDAFRAAAAVTTPLTAIRAFDRGLSIEALGSDDLECKTMLFGVERQ
jgi:hypothetical protein